MVSLHTTHQLRGYVSKAGHRQLADVLTQCATLYNAALQERRDAYRMAGKSVTFIDQCKAFTGVRQDWPEWEALDVQIGRGVMRRIDRAFNAFFRRVKAGETPGYPRFKSRRRYRTIEVAEPRPGMVKTAPDGKKAWVTVKGLPRIELRAKLPLPVAEHLRSLRIVIRPSGPSVDLGYALEQEPLPPNPLAVGIDLGVNNRMALSDGRLVERRRLNRRREVRLRQAVSRSRKGSNRRRKRVAMLSREARRNQVRNRNDCHQLTTGLVRQYGRIAVEKLVIRNMTRSVAGTIAEPGTNVAAKSGLNREILSQTWGLIRDQLRYKAEWAGREFVEVNPRYTSRICSACGEVTPQSEYRTYRCGVCGLIIDRDSNAAVNILKRAFGPDGGGNIPRSSQSASRFAQNSMQF